MRLMIVALALALCACTRPPSLTPLIFAVTEAREISGDIPKGRVIFNANERAAFLIHGKTAIGHQAFLEFQRDGGRYDVTTPQVVSKDGLWITPLMPFPPGPYKVTLFIDGQPAAHASFVVMPDVAITSR